MELEIESRNVAMTPRWKAEIEFRMGSLVQRYQNVIHGRVTLSKNRHHKKRANVAEALVVVALPERHTLTARKEHKTFEEAIRSAFQAVGIELRKYREKRAHTEVRLPPMPPHRGVVSKLFPMKRYGFILQEGGGEVYFHANALQRFPFEQLEDGTEVVFGLEQGDHGPQATVVALPQPTAMKVS